MHDKYNLNFISTGALVQPPHSAELLLICTQQRKPHLLFYYAHAAMYKHVYAHGSAPLWYKCEQLHPQVTQPCPEAHSQN